MHRQLAHPALEPRGRSVDHLSPRGREHWNLARLDLVAFRLVVLCTELGSLSAASRACHLSVSGASHRLATLEDSLNTKLFHRHRRGLTPTATGRAVASHGRLMIGVLDQLRAKLDSVD